jgi:glycosyltransferase involved in cell wall biosynthesis
MPLFSVIIPTYNRADLIGQTLDSVLANGLLDIEIIVVDDGSTDGTVSLIDRRYGTQVRVLQQANKGPGAARNLGLKSARGDYAAFLDSDDLWFPWTAATYARVIAEHNRPAFIAGKPFIFDSASHPLLQSPDGELTALAFPDYYASGDQWRWYSASSFVMRRDALLAAGGFTDEWVNAEDADAAMRMGAAGTFVQVTTPYTFGYRKHAGSAMSDLTRSFNGMRRLIEKEESDQFPGGAKRARERRRILSTFVRPLALSLLARGDRAAAWELYRRTFAWNLGLMRWKFLAGFPGRAVMTKLRAVHSS